MCLIKYMNNTAVWVKTDSDGFKTQILTKLLQDVSLTTKS